MSGREVDTHGLGSANVPADQALRAAVRVARQVAAEHPHPLDDSMPKLAGRLTGQDPVVAADLRDLLGALGLPTTRAQLRSAEARARIERAHQINRLREGGAS